MTCGRRGAAEDTSPDLARWRLRDKCLRVATFFRVMRLDEVARRRARLSVIRGRFQEWAVSFVWVAAERKRRGVHEQASRRQRAQRDERVCANTRMRMTPVGVYREEQRGARRGQLGGSYFSPCEQHFT